MQSSKRTYAISLGIAFCLAGLTIFMRLKTNALGAFNFAAIGALGMFAGSRIRGWWSFLLPVAVSMITDLILEYTNNDPRYGIFDVSRIWVYGCYFLYAIIGRFVIGDGKKPAYVAAGACLGPVQFFLITNFCEWLRLDQLYSRDFLGLIDCYFKAVPFAVNTFASDLILTPLVFALDAYLSRTASKPIDTAIEEASVV